MSEIAKLFATLGFRVEDEEKLAKFEKSIQNTGKTIKQNSKSVTKSNKESETSAKKAQRAQAKLYAEIKRNFAKVPVTLSEAKDYLGQINDMLDGGDNTARERKNLTDAKRRVQRRINYLNEQEQKARDKKLKAEQQVSERANKAKEAEDKKWRGISEKRDYEAWKLRNEQLKEAEAERKRIEREKERDARQQRARARQEAADRRSEDNAKLRRQKFLRDEQRKAAEERRKDRRLELAEQRQLNRVANRRRGKSYGGHYRGMREYGRAFVPGIGGAFAAMQSTQGYQDYVGMQAGLTAATGSQSQAQQEMGFLTNLSNKLGLFVGDLGKSYTNLAANTKGTSLEGAGTRDVFESVASYGRVLNLSTADQDGVFRALTQMVGKGQIYAEELRGQLGERLPGSIQAMARAAGKSVPELFKMMEDGELKAEDVFPKFSEELMKMANEAGALEKAMNSTAAAIGRFKTNVWLANKTFNESGYDQSVRDFFNTTSDSIQRSEPLWRMLGQAAIYVGNAFEAPVELFGAINMHLPKIRQYVEDNSTEVKLWTAALIALVAPLRKLFLITTILPLGLNAIADLLLNWNRDRSWEEWALQIGLAVAALGILANVLARVLGLVTNLKKAMPSVAPGATVAAAEAGIVAGLWKWAQKLGGGLGLMAHSEEIGGGLDYIPGSQGRPSFTDPKAQDEQVQSMMNRLNFMGSHGIAKANQSPQFIGDVNITVESPDPNLAGLKVQAAFKDLFGNELRLASGNEQVNEK